MTTQEKIEMLADIMEVDPATLKPETALADIPEYDSIQKLSIIVMFDDEFGKEIGGEKLREFKTVGDILAAMEK